MRLAGVQRCLLLFVYTLGSCGAFNISPHSKEVVDKVGDTYTLSCVISSLPAKVTKVQWKFNNRVVETYTTNVGGDSYDDDAKTQTTTLEVEGIGDDQRSDLQFTCVVTDPTDATNIEEETVDLKFYTITPHPRQVQFGAVVTISCSIFSLDAKADVKWIDPEGNDIPAGDSIDYIVDEGNFFFGSQVTKLTLKASKTELTDKTTYKCAATSTYYPGSPTFVRELDVTPLKVTISDSYYTSTSFSIALTCTVSSNPSTGIVTFIKQASDESLTELGTADLIRVSDSTDYRGMRSVLASGISGATFFCQADFSSIGAGVLKSDAKSPILLSILTQPVTSIGFSGDALTLSCEASYYSSGSSTTIISWLNADDTEFPAGTTSGITVTNTNGASKMVINSLSYNTDKNTPDQYRCKVLYLGLGLLESNNALVYVREIINYATATHNEFAGTSFTLSCTYMSNQEVTVSWKKGEDVISTGKTLYKVDGINIGTLVFSSLSVSDSGDYKCFATEESREVLSTGTATLAVIEVEAVSKEVKKGTETTISCVITGISASASVKWMTSNGEEVSGSQFTPVTGKQIVDTQTATLKVDGSDVIQDIAYTCRVQPDGVSEFDAVDTVVNLEVYEVEAVSKEVKKGTETTISCVITGLSDATATVTWRNSQGDAVSEPKFIPNEGSQEEGKQTATLKVAGSDVLEDAAYTCTIESGTYSASGSSNTVVKIDVYVSCKAGEYEKDGECKQCGENTYSGEGATECTPCEEGKVSAPGSTSEQDCKEVACDFPDLIPRGYKIQEAEDQSGWEYGVYQCYPPFVMSPNMDMMNALINQAGQDAGQAYSSIYSAGLCSKEGTGGVVFLPECKDPEEAGHCGIPDRIENAEPAELIFFKEMTDDNTDIEMDEWMKEKMTSEGWGMMDENMPVAAKYTCKEGFMLRQTMKGDMGWCRKDGTYEIPACISREDYFDVKMQLHNGDDKRLVNEDGQVFGGVVLTMDMDADGKPTTEWQYGCDDGINDYAVGAICRTLGFGHGTQIPASKKMMKSIGGKEFGWTQFSCAYDDTFPQSNHCKGTTYEDALSEMGMKAKCFDFDILAVKCFKNAVLTANVDVKVFKRKIMCNVRASKAGNKVFLGPLVNSMTLKFMLDDKEIEVENMTYKKRTGAFVAKYDLRSEDFQCLTCEISMDGYVIATGKSCKEDK